MHVVLFVSERKRSWDKIIRRFVVLEDREWTRKRN
jgi:hypothetical protein